MFSLGPEKLLIIVGVALVVLGPDKLPEVARQAGKVLRDFQKVQQALQANVRDVVEPIVGPITSGVMAPPSAVNGRGHAESIAAAPRVAGMPPGQRPSPATETTGTANGLEPSASEKGDG